MDYREMQEAEAELNAALAPQKKQRGATKAQLAYRAQFLHAAKLDALADSLSEHLDVQCDCPPRELEIGGHGHLSDCDTAKVRSALRSAFRLAVERGNAA